MNTFKNKSLLIVILLVLQLRFAHAQFVEQFAGSFPALSNSSVAWGDYDNDGDLDILLTGSYGNLAVSKIYQNTGTGFSEVYAGSLTGVYSGSVAWGDYDNDGDLDIFLTGTSGNSSIVFSKIYQNTGSGFIEVYTGSFPGVRSSSVAWGDYDNDGDLDVLLTGITSNNTPISNIYQNTGSGFAEVYAGSLVGVSSSSVAWGDYDNDGDLDIFLTGSDVSNNRISKIYQNTGVGFSEVYIGSITAVSSSSVAWGDYDNDGDLDILLTGYNGSIRISKIYQNTGSGFAEVFAGSLTGVYYGSVAWGDYDNDGDLDILLTGDTGTPVSKIYQNTGSGFTEAFSGSLTLVRYSSAAWGDYDNDGDLDILLAGNSSSGSVSKIYTNQSVIPNTIPSTPANLSSVVTSSVTLKWDRATDLQTPQNGLLYNIYIYEEGSISYKSSPHAFKQGDAKNGRRLIAKTGNIRWTSSGYTIKNLPGCGKKYYWSVQAVDGGLAGGNFAGESSFVITVPDAPVANLAGVSSTSFIAAWTASSCATNYYLDVASDIGFTSYVAGYSNKLVGNVTSYNVTGLGAGTIYYYRVRASNGSGSGVNSNITSNLFFKEQFAGSLTNVQSSAVAWGDYDNDGDLDILLTGYYYATKIYQNTGNGFTEVYAGSLGSVSYGSVAWGDYDNDGDLDILLTGQMGTPLISKIYQNTGNGFTEVYTASLTGVQQGSVAWGDYDNDGDLDILLTGLNSAGSPVSKIYQNTGSGFNEVYAGSITSVYSSSVAWGDYDNDGDLDILVTGFTGTLRVSKIYQNTGTGFTEVYIGSLTGLNGGSVVWGDYDNDGDLDILLTGYNGSVYFSKIYQNTGSAFTEVYAGSLNGVGSSSAAWGDYDNDGDLDILLTGYNNITNVSKIYQNTGTGFTEMYAGSLTGVSGSSAAWGDYDNDGDLDILLTGSNFSKIYMNQSSVSNTLPSAPANLTSTPAGNIVTLKWDKAIDSQTPQNGLLYNIYIYEEGSINYNTSPHAFKQSDAKNGRRLIARMGNIRWTTAGYIIKNLPGGCGKKYYWSVQAVDAALAGGNFSGEASFIIGAPDAPVVNTSGISPSSFNANWTTVSCATKYYLDVATDMGFTAYVTGYNNKDVGNVTSSTVTGLATGITYYYRVRAFSATGTSANSLTGTNMLFKEQFEGTFPGLTGNTIAWGDYDSDGDLDILLTGQTAGTGFTWFSKIYQNTGSGFIEVYAGSLDGVYDGAVAWGDYDNDGDLDILLTGNAAGSRKAKIYQNTGSGFVEVYAGSLTGVQYSSVAWGDYDNDGDLDILLTGHTGTVPISKIYQNTGSGFTEVYAGSLTGVYSSSVAWGDYDNDGDLDVLLTGSNISKIYQNTGSGFTEAYAGSLTGVSGSSAAWGDYDNDGDLDILISGNNISKIYQNTGSGFTEAYAGSLTGVNIGSVAWGDYDNDGKLDILLTGEDASNNYYSKIYRNTGSGFTEVLAGNLTRISRGSAIWGDYDSDGDLDILLKGYNANAGYNGATLVTKLYMNQSAVANTIPAAPATLTSTLTGNSVTLKWNQTSDTQTPQSGLLYNIYIYEEGSSNYRVSPHAFKQSDAKNGRRLIAKTGDIRWTSAGYTIKNLPGGCGKTYYWSVQAVDAGLSGGSFAGESSFAINVPAIPVVYTTGVSSTGFIANWTAVGCATKYYLDVATDVGFTSYFTGHNNKDLGNVTSYNVTGLAAGTTYYYRVRAYNASGASANSNIATNLFFKEQLAGSINSVMWSSVAWGDYDNDGDLDILLTGDTGTPVSKIYQNTGSGFTEVYIGSLTGLSSGSAAWGDYDNDGDLDILLTGYASGTPISKIYQNTGSGFTEVYAGSLTGVSNGSVAWGDYDNDGDLDILLTGFAGTSISKIYQNTGSGFAEVFAGSITNVYNSSVAWGDFDNDGDLDILLTGHTGSTIISKIYQNTGSGFTEVYTGSLTGVSSSSVAWGDYDNDGDLDILLSGFTGSLTVSKIYQNTGSGFAEVFAGSLTGVNYSSGAWGDYDNDGDLDILLTGQDASNNRFSKIYQNTGSGFIEVYAGSLTSVYGGSVAWGDYDNDGDLDILLTGNTGGGPLSKIYLNQSAVPNTIPAAPANLTSVVTGKNVTVKWDKPSDTQTPQAGLLYNIYIYEAGSSNYKASPHAFRQSDVKNGRRLIAKMGNIRWTSAGYTFKNLPGCKTYYWSVQAIDAGLAGGNFAGESSFVIDAPDAPVVKTGSVSSTSFIATWTTVGCATKYYLDVATDVGITAFVAGYNNKDVGNVLSYNVTGLGAGTTYYYRVRAYNATGTSSNSNIATNVVYNEQFAGSFTGVFVSSVAWGDYDKDGDLDVLLTGADGTGAVISRIYQNTGSSFTEVYAGGQPGVYNSSVAWGDYDNDDDLDILLTGNTGGIIISRIYQNTGSGFTEVYAGSLSGVHQGSVAWGDYDNDGDLDIILSGNNGSVPVSKIYQNTGSGFTEVYAGSLTGVNSGSLTLGDYDNDGDLDILLTGKDAGNNPVSKIYQNTGSGFNEVYAGSLTAVFYSSAAWGDYDNDGDLDILLTGYTGSLRVSKIYQNTGSGFSEIYAGSLTGVVNSSVAWGDNDNDGDLDILLTGNTGSAYISKIYQNTGTGFTEAFAGSLTGVYFGAVAWADFDNDGDLDILLSGHNGSVPISKLYTNQSAVSNTMSAAPGSLISSISGSDATFTWGKATDTETAQNGLTYNLYVYEDGQPLFKKTPHSFTKNQSNSGRRLIAQTGNIQYKAAGYLVKNLPDGTYKWSVQAVDAGLKGGDFATEGIFYIGKEINVQGNSADIINGDITPSVTDHTDFGNISINANLIRTYTIQNPGSTDLTLGTASVSGSGFSITQPLLATVGANSSTTFTVKFAPATTGIVTGTVSVPNNDVNENPYTFAVTGTGIKSDQTITFEAMTPVIFGNPGFDLTATASSGLTVSFQSSNLAVATISGTTVTIVGAGETTITASQTGDENYNSASNVLQTLTVNKATPVVTWANPSAITYGTALSATQLNASPSVPGTLTYTPVSGTVLNAGSGQTLSVDFAPTDATNYNSVNGTTVLITVNKATPVITWADPSAITYGTALSATQLNASPGVPGTLTYSPVSGTTLNAGTNQTLSVDFVPTDATNYNSVDGTTVVITVDKASQSITFNALDAKTCGDNAFNLGASSNSGLSVTYSSSDPAIASISGNTVTILQAGITTITASQTGNINYNAASDIDRVLTINTIDNSVTQNGNLLTANATGLAYQWVDCNNGNAPLSGENNQSFTALADGSYAVIVTNNGCSRTSNCFTVITTGISENSFGNTIKVFPNPTSGNVTLDLGTSFTKIEVSISNSAGKVIERKSYFDAQRINFRIDGSNGLYFITILNTNGKKVILKVIKE